MIVAEFIWALLIATVLTAVFGLGIRREGFGVGLLFLFVLLFLFTWAGGVWVPPLGPAVGGVSWLSFIVVGVLFALLWAAVSPPPRKHRPPTPGEEHPPVEVATATVFNVFFWILVAGLLIIIAARHL